MMGSCPPDCCMWRQVLQTLRSQSPKVQSALREHFESCSSCQTYAEKAKLSWRIDRKIKKAAKPRELSDMTGTLRNPAPTDYKVDCSLIKRSPESKILYTAEHKIQEMIGEAAFLWLGVKEKGPENFWTLALPSELYTILEGFQRESAEAAAVAFLKKQGYTVEGPK